MKRYKGCAKMNLENRHLQTFLNRNGFYGKGKNESLHNEQLCNSEKLNSGLAAGVLIKKNKEVL